MTRTSTRRTRPSKKKHHYRPQTVKMSELRSDPRTAITPPRIIYVQNPYYQQMESGTKTVEARPNYPCFRDLVPGTLVEFRNRYSGRSFLATITSRRVHRDFQTMLRQETIKDCLPDRDPDDLQRAVNVYHAFRHGTYKFIARKHGVVSLRFEKKHPEEPEPEPETDHTEPIPITYDRSEYQRNSLCAIFDYVQRKHRERKYGIN